jgi:GNAT superfamily N-acetyltransferase
MGAPQLTVISAVDCPDLLPRADEVTIPAWPEFMHHDPAARRWRDLYQLFPQFQFALEEPGADELAAVGNGIPLAWNGELGSLPESGWDWAMQQGFDDHAAGETPRTLCALSIVVSDSFRSRGVSADAVRTMTEIARTEGMRRLIVPARPTMKASYPLVPIDRYIRWRRADGLPFDSWLRVHERLGAEIVKPCSQSMRITGSLAEWEEWTRMQFPESGTYVVPGALVTVEIDCERDVGVYVEPNVWICHVVGEDAHRADARPDAGG